MQQFSVARGISQAQEQMQQLKAAEIGEIEKRTALQEIANNLALNLGKTGAPVHQIQSAVGAVAPMPIRDANDAYIQSQTSGSLTDLYQGMDKRTFDNEAALIDRRGQWALDSARYSGQLANQRLQNTNAQKDKTSVLSYQKEFNDEVKDQVSKISNLGQAERLLDLNNPVADQTLKMFLARASGEKGPLSDSDIQLYGGSKALARKVQRAVSEKAFGTLTPQDRSEMLQVIQNYRKTNNDELADKIEQLAGQMSSNLGGKPEDYYNTVTGANPILRDAINQRKKKGKEPETSAPGPASKPKSVDELINKFKPGKKGASISASKKVAGGSFFQGNQPASLSGSERPEEIGLPSRYIERLIDEASDLEDLKKKLKFGKSNTRVG